MASIHPFSGDHVQWKFETDTHSPLTVYPNESESDLGFNEWAQNHQEEIAQAIKEYGAVVFSGFNLNEQHFYNAFKAATGECPDSYKGDTPRVELVTNIYKSTAVAPNHPIPPHQEVSGSNRKDMPKYISFFCVSPPEPGTGQTQVASAKSVSKDVERLMPELWKKMQSDTLTYKARYLPSDSWTTKWIRWLNPSHATIQQRFGTEVRREVEEKCKEEGVEYRWDGDWIVVSRTGVPPTIDVDGTTLFCNQIHNDKFSPELCGGWVNYILGRIFLYPTSRWMQFDVEFDDGTEISSSDAGSIIPILEKHQVGRDWKEGDLMIIDNATTMHAKTPHSDEFMERKIIVAMGGSAEDYNKNSLKSDDI